MVENDESVTKMRRAPGSVAMPALPISRTDAAAAENIGAVLRDLADLAGFKVAALSRPRPEAARMHLVEVVGAQVSDDDLLRTSADLTEWLRSLRSAERWGTWFYTPGSDDKPLPNNLIPELAPTENPHAWHPNSSLIHLVHDANGDMIGALHLDVPVDRLVPTPERRGELGAIGRMASRSMAAVLEAAEARRRAELAAAMQATAVVAKHTSDPHELTQDAAKVLLRTVGADDVRSAWFHPGLSHLNVAANTDLADQRAAVVADWREHEATVLTLSGDDGATSLRVPVGDAATCYGVMLLERIQSPAAWTTAEVNAAIVWGRDLGRALTEDYTRTRIETVFDDLRTALGNRAQAAADVAHDLSSPLRVIRSYLDLLDRPSEAGDTDPTVLLDALRVGTAHVSEIAELLHDLARRDPELGMPPEHVNVAVLLHNVAQVHAPVTEHNDLSLTLTMHGEDTTVYAVPSELHRVAMNLTNNAAKFTPPGGSISITAHADGGEAVLRWVDSGPGISEEHLPFVFDEFYRAPDPWGVNRAGSGLGLAIVQRLVHKMGGTVTISSVLGSGTTVVVRLPLSKGETPPPPR